MLNTKAFYEAEFDFGTPAQTVNLFLDTGSSWTWVWADRCPSEIDTRFCPYQERFHTTKSSTFMETEEIKRIQYGMGQSEGPISYDLIAFTSDSSVKAEPMEFFI